MYYRSMVAVQLLVVGLVPMLAIAVDEDPLQDFCVADTAAGALTINGFPCKPAAQVSADDFKFAGLKAFRINTKTVDIIQAQFPA